LLATLGFVVCGVKAQKAATPMGMSARRLEAFFFA
jgi:hypothetical protein